MRTSTITWYRWDEKLPEESKAKNGSYVLVIKGNANEVGTINWSDECGWNTHRTLNGTIDPETKIENDGHYIKAWAYFPEAYDESEVE